MAIDKKLIQVRYGAEADYDESKMITGEPAVTTDTQRVFFGTGPGKAVELAKQKVLESEISKLSEQNADLDSRVEALEQGGTSGTGAGWNTTQINLLENIGQYLLFSDAKTGQTLFDSLITSLRNSASGGGESEKPENPDATLTSISATYTGGEVTAGTALSALTGITVTGTWSDGSTTNITGYALSGTIAEGENIITVTYEGLTTTFTVTGVAESEGGDDTPVTYTITNSLTGCTTDNTAASVEAGASYTATITSNFDTYNVDSVVITMGGTNITDTVYADGVITIPEVTGNIVIAITHSEVVTLLYELPEPTTFNGTNYIDTGIALWDEDRDWSIVFDAASYDESSKLLFAASIYNINADNTGVADTVALSFTHKWGTKEWAWKAAGYSNSIATGTNTIKGIVTHTKNVRKPQLYLTDTTGTALATNNPQIIDAPLILGGRLIDGALSDGFIGTINTFKVYNRVLTAEEIGEYLGV